MSVGTADEATLPPHVARRFGDVGRRRRPFASSWGTASVRGPRRNENEDACDQRDGRSFAVADGMGGRPGGAAAAATAVTVLLDHLRRSSSPTDWQAIVARTNHAVRERATLDGIERSGAAIAAIHCSASGVTVLHLGDVRVYRLRHGTPEQLTTDHNVAEQLARDDINPARLGLRAGELAALTGYLGDEDSATDFAVRGLSVLDGDRLVACTDGVHRHLDETVWQAIDSLDDRAAAALVVDAALRAGGTDDATALVLSLGFDDDVRSDFHSDVHGDVHDDTGGIWR